MTFTRTHGRSLRVLGPLAVAIGLFVLVPLAQGHELTSFSVYSALQLFSTYGLLALAIGLTMVAGEFDLSALGMFALGSMVAVKAGGESPWLGVLAAIGVGCLAGLVQGTVIARLGISSMAVTLGGYLTLLGMTYAIGDDKSVSYPRLDVGTALDAQRLTIFSWHSGITFAAVAVLATAMAWTRVGRDLRAVGAGRRASRVAGVRVDVVLVGVFAASGALAATAGALNGYSLASALPNPGFSPLIFAATAAIIGGVRLTGGQGTAFGIAAGALSIALLQTMFGVIASPQWVSDVVTGALLALAALLAAPELRARSLGVRAMSAHVNARLVNRPALRGGVNTQPRSGPR